MKTQLDINAHYGILLGLVPPWTVVNVDLQIENHKVEINVKWPDSEKVECPECRKLCSIRDFREERRWRHLDVMQFQTIIISKIPRSECKEHGIKTINTPWAHANSRFTLMFERLAVDVIKAAKSLTNAGELLGLSWDEIHKIQKRAVERGLLRRNLKEIQNIGIDEKSFLSGHKYASLMVDIDQARIIDVVQGRDLESANALWGCLSGKIKKQVKAVAMDMWDAFITSTKINAPEAKIVHDKFHISKYLNEAVDKVRKQEHKLMMKNGDKTLTGKKYLFLKSEKNMSLEEIQSFEVLKNSNLKVGKAWTIKEMFSEFWNFTYETSARKFFNKWFMWATHSRLAPIIKAAKTIKTHFENIVTYLKHRITNATIEGFNSKIQSLKTNARGFRNFENYRITILFNCGKLDLYPA